MLSIEQCRKKLEAYGKRYTDEEVAEIREHLYYLAKHALEWLGREDEKERMEKHKSKS